MLKNKKLLLWALIGILAYWFLIRPMIDSTSQLKGPINESFEGKLNDDVPKFVNFNTSWCGYSKKVQPAWDQLTKEVDSSKVEVIDLKCDVSENEALCESEGIQGYPTIRLYKNGKHHDYTGDRTTASMKSFLQEQCY